MSYYGIDLGTTNSLIGLYEKKFLSKLVPSCVNLTTGVVGSDAFEDMAAKRSFKVDISLGTEGIMPVTASSAVLKELKRIAGGDCVKDVVISVPAYFSDNQRQATVNAATKSGLDVKGLVNEPTAAAMYIAQKKKSLFVVYDLGGGTFDVSIIDARFGSYDVQATDGRIIGGDNFDKAILQYFVKQGNIALHKMNKEQVTALQHFASKQKIAVQKAHADIVVDLSQWGGNRIVFKEKDYIQLMKLTFGETITLLKRMVNAYIPDNEHYEVLLVGGSTRCPYLREWIGETLDIKIDVPDYDPDRVVAQGAALYAHILETSNIDAQVSDVTKQLSIAMADGTCNVIVEANSKIPLSVEQMITNSTESDKLSVNLLQGEALFASENECIGTLVYDYGEVKAPMDGTVFVTVDIDNKGTITFSVKEMLKKPQVVVLDRNSAVVK